MKPKRFFLTAVGLTLAALLGLVAAIAAFPPLDPFFVAHGVGDEETALFKNQRYEMPGLIRNQDYRNVVMGTSLAANYRASWFTGGLGGRTLKITFPDGWLTEFDRALSLAYATHPELDTVCFGLDLNILVRPDSQREVELPLYLYNTNPLDDAAYFLNKEIWVQTEKSLNARLSGEDQPLDEAYIWDGEHTFSRAQALGTYQRPDILPAQPADACLTAAAENLALVTGWAQAHPDTRFLIWFAPYSILYWDMQTRQGRVDAYLAALELAFETLTRYDNVTLFCFLGREEIITDLDNYTDHVHCSGRVTRLEAEEMMAGTDPVTADNYRARLDALRELVKSYDYEALFEQDLMEG